MFYACGFVVVFNGRGNVRRIFAVSKGFGISKPSYAKAVSRNRASLLSSVPKPLFAVESLSASVCCGH